MIYLDTGCLVKLYYPEPESPSLARLVSGSALVFTTLHELEVANALELKVFRKEASAAQVKATHALVAADVSSGLLHRPSVSWADVWKQADAFARQHTRLLGCRSLDILHCAVAAQLDPQLFVTTDGRQARLAAKIGLRCRSV